VKITPDSTILVRAFDDSGGLARQLLFTIRDGVRISLANCASTVLCSVSLAEELSGLVPVAGLDAGLA